MADPKQILAAAIEFERFGVEYYMRFNQLVADDKAKALMKSLSNDEKDHASILEKELKTLGGSFAAPPKEMVDKGLSEIFPKSTKKNSITVNDSVEAIKVGIKTEQNSIDFYSRNGKAAGPALKGIFAKLQKMEEGHKELLEENLRYLQNDGSWYGYVPILEG
jgi:rubrerythrin